MTTGNGRDSIHEKKEIVRKVFLNLGVDNAMSFCHLQAKFCYGLGHVGRTPKIFLTKVHVAVDKLSMTIRPL